jgi:hypothetical protein
MHRVIAVVSLAVVGMFVSLTGLNLAAQTVPPAGAV